MKYALAKVVKVQPLPGFKLRLAFADGAQGIYDCEPILWGELFEPLKIPEFFAQVSLDHGAPTWPNGADLDPGVLRTAIDKTPPKAGKTRSRESVAVGEDAAPYVTSPVAPARHAGRLLRRRPGPPS